MLERIGPPPPTYICCKLHICTFMRISSYTNIGSFCEIDTVLIKVHVLVIPKGEYVDLDDFNNNASDKEIVELNKAVTHVANLMGSKDKGYRTLTNIGSDGGQEVPHLHFHIFAGEKIGKMVN